MTTYTTQYDDTYTIINRVGTYYDEDTTQYNIFEAHNEEGELVSELYTNIETGQIMNIWTREENQREGIATALIRFATDNGYTLLHSPEWQCSEDGQAFATSIDFIDTINIEEN